MHYPNRNLEWTNYDEGKGDSGSRYGCPTNYFLPQSSLGTKIGSNNFSRLSLIQNKLLFDQVSESCIFHLCLF